MLSHVQDDDPSLLPHPQLAGQADDEGGGGEAVHQTPPHAQADEGQGHHPPQLSVQDEEEGGGGTAGEAVHHPHRDDEHLIEPRRRGLRPKKKVRYRL